MAKLCLTMHTSLEVPLNKSHLNDMATLLETLKAMVCVRYNDIFISNLRVYIITLTSPKTLGVHFHPQRPSDRGVDGSHHSHNQWQHSFCGHLDETQIGIRTQDGLYADRYARSALCTGKAVKGLVAKDTKISNVETEIKTQEEL